MTQPVKMTANALRLSHNHPSNDFIPKSKEVSQGIDLYIFCQKPIALAPELQI
jgi:DNA repair protein RadC